MSRYRMAALITLVLPFSAFAGSICPEGSSCSVDIGKTHSAALLQMPSATVSTSYIESDADEELETQDANVMRSDDQDLKMQGQGKHQLAGTPLTCSQEEAIRKKIAVDMKVKARRSARIVRAVFHDAVDANNLLIKNNKTGKWEPVEGNYGGVDDCMYSPLTEGDEGHPEPSHNKNLGGISVAYMKLCNQLCSSDTYATTKLCADKSSCEVDMRVLGALVTIEGVGGPRIPMTWGRKKGQCVKMVSSDGKPNQLALRFAPSLTAIDDADAFRTAFERLGFSAKDQAALMGAHTFGKLAVCAGGLNGVEKGNFCNNPAKLDPPLKSSNFAPWSVPPGPCKPVVGKIGGGVSNGCWAKTKGGDLAPVHAFETSSASGKYGRGLGDGGFFDRTPTIFDNDYYKLVAESTYDGKDVCCGKVKKGKCDRAKGAPERSPRNKNGRSYGKTTKVKGGECAIDWCRDDRKANFRTGKLGKTHMKSTRAWAEAPHDFVKKGYKFGVTKRLIRLAGDWALLGNEATHASVKLFAKDQSAFFEAFKVAFGKVINKGYTDLASCSSPKTAEQVKSQSGARLGKGRSL